MVARLSGDEFGLIIDGAQPEGGQGAGAAADRSDGEGIRDRRQVIHIGVTVGVAVFPHNGNDAAALLANADVALFRAKAESRGSVCVFEARWISRSATAARCITNCRRRSRTAN